MAVSAARVATRRVANGALRRLLLAGHRHRAGRPGRDPLVPGRARASAGSTSNIFTKTTPAAGSPRRPAQRHRRLDHDVRAGAW